MRQRSFATLAAALTVLTVPSVARADVINPGAMVAEHLFSIWGVAGAFVLGWPAVHIATGRSWARSILATLVAKLPSALAGPVLLFITGGFVISFTPLGLAGNVTASAAMYALVDLAALRLFFKSKPTARGFAALFVTNLVLVATAMLWFVTMERELWLRIRAVY